MFMLQTLRPSLSGPLANFKGANMACLSRGDIGGGGGNFFLGSASSGGWVGKP